MSDASDCKLPYRRAIGVLNKISERKIGSIIMTSLGIIGYYIARIYEAIKGICGYIISISCRNCEIQYK